MLFSFFFSSRRRHTRWNCDWSSDVCSSDLGSGPTGPARACDGAPAPPAAETPANACRLRDTGPCPETDSPWLFLRSEERRVGKEGRARWWPYHQNKINKDEAETWIISKRCV